MYLVFNGIIYVQSTSLTNLFWCWFLQMLTEIRPLNFCWNEPFTPNWKNGFRCCCSWIWQSSCLSPTSYCSLHGSYCTFSQEEVSDHMSIMAPVQCKVEKALWIHYRSNQCHSTVTFTWSMTESLLRGHLVQHLVELFRWDLWKLHCLSLVLISHQNNMAGIRKKAFRKTFDYNNFLPLFSVPLYSP